MYRYSCTYSSASGTSEYEYVLECRHAACERGDPEQVRGMSAGPRVSVHVANKNYDAQLWNFDRDNGNSVSGVTHPTVAEEWSNGEMPAATFTSTAPLRPRPHFAGSRRQAQRRAAAHESRCSQREQRRRCNPAVKQHTRR